MKIRVTMKDPDCLDNAVREAAKAEVDAITGIFEGERELLIEERVEAARKACCLWFKHGEYLTVELDTESKTAFVVPR